MRINPERIFDRDLWTCYLCANMFEDGSLVPHHRGNRGAGGFKGADTPANILSLCSLCNGVIEAHAGKAATARRYGIKISKFDVAKADQIPVAAPAGMARAWVILGTDYSIAPARPEHAEEIERMDEN